MLPLREPEPEPEPVLPRPARRERAKVIRRVAPWTPAPAPEMVRLSPAAGPPENPDHWPVPGGRLSLDDTPQPHIRVSGNRSVPPWTLGLRG